MASFTPGQILFAAQLLAALGEKPDASLLGTANGIATLGADGKLLPGQIPALSISDVFVVASQAAMLALTAQRGDVAMRTDLSKTFILAVEGAATLANWQEVLVPAGGGVSSVAGRTGAVTLTADDLTDAGATGKLAIRASSAAVLTALLNLATSANKGLLPPLSGNSNQFLDGTGTFALPPAATQAPPDYQVFTASGTWTKPAFATGNQVVIVEIIGAGGGGCSASAYAGGGAGGSYGRIVLRAADLAATVAVTIGAGGTAGATGGTGGTTTFGSLLSLLGGTGGATAADAQSGNAAGTADLLNIGGAGADGAAGFNAGTVFGRAAGGGGGRQNSLVLTASSVPIANYGGSGGAGSTGTASAGTIPGGGGGGGSTGGPGGRGEIRVTTLH
ncbi:MAG: hypothetical protein JWM36_3257 [Hyphomicrobiales bacterium]|nr:hypothetical protein [Hyphomicrobiales bacterium]